MRIINADPGGAILELTRDELRILNNALNEVCHGPDAIEDEGEFHTRMGAEPVEAKTLLGQFKSALG